MRSWCVLLIVINHTSHVMNINCFLLPHVLLKSGCSLNLIPSSYFQSAYSYYRFSHEVAQLEVGHLHVCTRKGQRQTHPLAHVNFTVVCTIKILKNISSKHQKDLGMDG